MTATLALSGNGDALQRIIQTVTDAVTSPGTKRNYARALADFMAWYRQGDHGPLSKATVQRYRALLLEEGKSPSNVNQRLSAIRKLAQEAADNGALPDQTAQAIARVPGVRQLGQRVGNWLSKHDAEMLLDAPGRDTLRGLRDRALLGVAIGCGLRRQELADLTCEHVQMRDARWVIVDLVGKGNRLRTVPMPSWAKVLIDEWTAAAGIESGHLFRPVNKGECGGKVRWMQPSRRRKRAR